MIAGQLTFQVTSPSFAANVPRPTKVNSAVKVKNMATAKISSGITKDKIMMKLKDDAVTPRHRLMPRANATPSGTAITVVSTGRRSVCTTDGAMSKTSMRTLRRPANLATKLGHRACDQQAEGGGNRSVDHGPQRDGPDVGGRETAIKKPGTPLVPMTLTMSPPGHCLQTSRSCQRTCRYRPRRAEPTSAIARSCPTAAGRRRRCAGTASARD